jgi:hypothetical protein
VRTFFPALDRSGRDAGVTLFVCCLAVAVDFWEFTLPFAFVFEAEEAEALRAGALLDPFFGVLALDEVVAFDFVALRAGALSAADERLTIGFGRADLAAIVRFFAVDAEGF